MPIEMFMVYCAGNRLPRVIHDSLADAKEEAERISKKERRATYVFKAIIGCHPDPPVEPTVKWERL